MHFFKIFFYFFYFFSKLQRITDVVIITIRAYATLIVEQNSELATIRDRNRDDGEILINKGVCYNRGRQVVVRGQQTPLTSP